MSPEVGSTSVDVIIFSRPLKLYSLVVLTFRTPMHDALPKDMHLRWSDIHFAEVCVGVFRAMLPALLHKHGH